MNKCINTRFEKGQISSTLPLSNNNSDDKSKKTNHKKYKITILNKYKIPKTNTKYKAVPTISQTNVKENLSNLINFKFGYNIKTESCKKYSCHSVTYSKRNLNSLNENFDSKYCFCPCCDYVSPSYKTFNTPKKSFNSNIRIKSDGNLLIYHRYMTESNLKKRINYTKIKKDKKACKKDNLIANNLFKKIKLPCKIPYKRIDTRNDIKYNNKYTIEKFKTIDKRKLKIDLLSVNDIECKKERLNNFLYGPNYMTEKKECELCHKLIFGYLYKFHFYSHPTKILNWMYLGTFKNANNIEEIKNLGINYILNCALEIKPTNLPKYIKYCHLKLVDNSSTDITKYFDQAFSFIELSRKNKGKILIHCKLGISRSPTILIGYFIKYMGHTTESALNFLKIKRTQIHPNLGFISQLNSYEKIYKKNQCKILSLSNSNLTTDLSLSK